MSENRELSNSEHEDQDDSTTAVKPVHDTNSQDPSTRNTPETTAQDDSMTAVKPVQDANSQDLSTRDTPETTAQDDSTTAVKPVQDANSQDLSTRDTPETTDAESDMIYTKQLRKGNPTIDFNVASGINKRLLNNSSNINKGVLKKEVITRPNAGLASANFELFDTINIIDTYDRPGCASAEGIYAGTGTYASVFKDKPDKRIPKAGAFAEAGVGRARAAFSVFEAEAKGPNASARADANVIGAGAIARAEVASASAKVGPVGGKVGLGFDTGATIGLAGVEVKVLGIGFSVGPKTSISFLGSEVSCSVM